MILIVERASGRPTKDETRGGPYFSIERHVQSPASDLRKLPTEHCKKGM